MKKTIIAIGVVTILILTAVLIIRFSSPEDTWICQNGQWVKHGNPDLPKPNSACPLSNNSKNEVNQKTDKIIIEGPSPNEIITSPLVVKGQAVGNWFFEATFPLILKDENDNLIAQSYATAKGEWMTENFVPFEGIITFEKPQGGEKGILIFKKDNPSDLPQYDEELAIPVFFK